MTEFKVGDEVIYDYSGERSTLTRKIPEGERFSGMWDAIGPDGNGRIYKEDEITLTKQETKVTEFKAGDIVRMVRSRNAFGDEGVGHPIGSLQELVSIDKYILNQHGWVAWQVVAGGWVRSDDIELVSCKEEPLTVELTSDMIDWEDALFGEHATDEYGANYRIERVEEDLVSIKIKKSIVWSSEDLIELGSHILALAEYLETGTVDLSDDCIECENEHLRESNERLVSSNEAKRQRLAKIRELTEV